LRFTAPAGTIRPGATLLWIFILFTLSGLTALVLETVFLRQLTWLFGSGATATTLVLAAFMAGLALGSAALGRVADRSTRPLRLYGLLELGAAATGAGLAWLLGSGREILIEPLRALGEGPASRVAETLLAFVLVLVPSLLMGGTLPALSRLIIRDPARFVGSLGRLYAVNTLGAAVGVFLAGFYLIEWLGVARSAWLAALLQAGVGVAALLLQSRWGPMPARSRSDGAGETLRPPLPTVRAACLTAAGIGGLAVLGYEVLWTRLLSLSLRSFTYSFSLMLAVFLLGLVLGAVLLATGGGRIRRPVVLLGWLQLAMGVYVATSVLWIPALLAPQRGGSFAAFLTHGALRAALIVLPPTILSGMALPLAARGFAGGLYRVGRDVGLVYAVNTSGAIGGALLAGLVLLPALGAPAALVVLAVANGLAGALVLLAPPRTAVRSALAFLLAAACALPLLATSERFVEAFLRASRGSDKIGELLYFHEGANDTVAIVRKEYGWIDAEAKSLITNGVAMSATVKPVWRYMALEGHLPVLLAGEPRSAIVIGVGTGITLGAVASHGRVNEIDALELSRGVLDGLPHFAAENMQSHEDPRVALIHEDGRRFLELTRRSYDLVTLEPPPPIVAGSVHLYSLDFYRICLRRLRPGGVVAQWLPLHAQSLASARMTASTFLEAFPEVQLWLPSVRDAVLIGSAEPLRLDLDRLDAAYASPSTRRNLRRAYLETPEALLATYLLDRRGVERWADAAPLITDERPRMEFFKNQGGNLDDRDIGTLLEPPQADWSWIAGLETRPELQRAIAEGNLALRAYVRSTVDQDPAQGAEAARMETGTEFFLSRFGCATRQLEVLRTSTDDSRQLRAQLQRCDQLRQ
jgi:spermidine synthase